MKKKLSIFILVLFCILFQNHAHAAELTFEGTNGTLGEHGNIVWNYDVDTKTVKVSGNDVIQYWYDGQGGCQSVIGLLVKNKKAERIIFSDCAFSYYSSENSNYLYDLFRNCDTLKEADLSGLDTSGVRNMQCMFYSCSSLERVDLSNLNTSDVSNMAYMFRWCESLKEIDLGSFNTENVTNFEGMFDGCLNVQKINIGNFTSKKIEHVNYMFSQCHKLEEIDLGGLDISNIDEAIDVFSECDALNKIQTPKSMGKVNISLPALFCDSEGNVYKELKKENLNKILNKAQIPNPTPSKDKNPIKKPVLKTQTIIVSKEVKKTVSYKASKLKKKIATLKIGAKAKTKLSYKVSKYPKNAKKYITVSKSGVVTMKKGAKKGTYKVTVTALAEGAYAKAIKTITIKVK